ncbi:MAG TPA: ribonuclease HII [Alphaproteobacteria bacterium]|nr:ribonuclease HII [Alphaproteobacteria bacterium]
MPDFEIEDIARRDLAPDALVAGVDEVGRGPWAGPVVAAAVILARGAVPDGLDDSKALSKARREALFDEITGAATIGCGMASVAEIDTLNILQASLLAMTRAVEALGSAPHMALVDGNRAPRLACPVKTVVKGDAKSLSIAAASIIAKVTRDRLMAELAIEHPAYGWERNAGYGTAEHREGLQLVGICRHHRKSFAPIRQLMTQDSMLKA